MKDIFYSNGLCDTNDNVEMKKMPLSPTNLYENFIISINGQNKYFLKHLIDTKYEIFFKNELLAAIDLGNLNIAPKVVYFNSEQRIIITEFINATNGFEDKIELIAKQINYFHTKCNAYNDELYLGKKDFWFTKYELLPANIKSDFQCAYDIIVNQKRYYDKIDEVVSHNDFHQSNILVCDNIVYLIDFDHLGLNTKYFDLATIAVSLQLSKKNELRLLESYCIDYDYNKFATQKAICGAHYALSSIALVENIEDIHIAPVKDSKAFSWMCNSKSEINVSRLRLAYNFLNYFKCTNFQ